MSGGDIHAKGLAIAVPSPRFSRRQVKPLVVAMQNPSGAVAGMNMPCSYRSKSEQFFVRLFRQTGEGMGLAKKGKHSSFFVKKEAKKLLIPLVRSAETPETQINKSFLLLFFKKEVLSLTSLPSPYRPAPLFDFARVSADRLLHYPILVPNARRI